MKGLWLLSVLGLAALGVANPACVAEASPPLSALAAPPGRRPVLRVVQGGSGGRPVLQNGGFETIANGKPASWQAAAQGFQLAAGAGRNGSSALGCEIVSGRAWSGASQTLPLDRTN